jgi:hypothetical protein
LTVGSSSEQFEIPKFQFSIINYKFTIGIIDIIGNKKYLPAKNAKRAKIGKIEDKVQSFCFNDSVVGVFRGQRFC